MTNKFETPITNGAQVTLHFSLALTNGDLIDSNFGKKAATFRVGDGNMLPGFEQILLGLRAQDEVDQTIPAAQAFGEPNPRNEQLFPLEKFDHLLEDDLVPTEVGSVVSFKDPGGFDLPGVVKEIGEKTIKIDFNHPLAGKDIVFKVKILSILPAEEQAIEIKL
ncbi:MAG TPA: peptidylprolyl isomerase [Gammaproteobacteria bacterium]|nr:peptidylprolyl isomerase [Gammaproteobacteria bacterium]RPG45487.1 MAG: peptidylprolyl isomerase [Gammaproteobacteria bacterium TMED163]HAO87930.1 peptidylprolyl isomerase [Gammaproteobacteria bacterium]HAU23779.1 peptidylprolyl isomerase [Gammaproteobacteria bacterium]HBJ89039.1 peptidylprolyl isomerase [Gammaproteobacteria bacterium]|tara:strand:- start:179 stop:670 length:492 start_codon:yes stop_codon:yes gene_type:complete